VTRALEEMSKEELVRELEKQQTAARRSAARRAEPNLERLLHELEVHQVELEMQNRELREAHGRLEEAMIRYADLYDFAPVGYCTLDAAGTIREINLTGAALLGAPRLELEGRPFASAARLRESGPLHAHLRRCTQEKTRVTTELRLPRGKRGGRCVVQLVTDPVFGNHGEATTFRTMLVDISELKALQGQLELLSHAGEALASSLAYTTMLDIVVRLAVPAVADLCIVDVLGEEGELERHAVVFADADKQKVQSDRLKSSPPASGRQTPQAQVMATGEPMMRSAPLDARGEPMADEGRMGRSVHSWMVVPLIAHGRTLGVLTLAAIAPDRRYTASDLRLARDLATRAGLAMDNARLYAAAHAAIAARDAILAAVSHDLRNPLGGIVMRVQHLIEELSEIPPEAIRNTLMRIGGSAEQMNRLIDDLVDAVNIDAGKLSLDKSPQQVTPLVREALDAAREQGAHKSLRVDIDWHPDAPLEIDCDRIRIQQVFANLLGNAVKFTPDEGTIVLVVEHGERELVFSVVDSGPGIAPADLPHVFERFFQGRKTGRTGMGLGLSIAKAIVEGHGGRIWVESQVGVGSTFVFTLPLPDRGCA